MKLHFGRTTILCLTFVLVLSDSIAADRFVSPNGSHVPPFADWASAATNIQDAIDASSPLDTVWVTNGVYSYGGRAVVYSSGGRPVAGTVTNRVTIDKVLTVQSVNGPEATIIEGAWDPATNGPTAVRCLWITNGATLRGFTLRKGATLPFSGGGIDPDKYGGGVYGASTNSRVIDSVLTGNAAGILGGGAYRITLTNCLITGNIQVGLSSGGSTDGGGGASDCVLYNCKLTGNQAASFGGGAYNSTLRNCAVVLNRCRSNGGGLANSKSYNTTVSLNFVSDPFTTGTGGAFNSTFTNCILYQNFCSLGSNTNYSSCTFAFSCTAPLPAGPGNVAADPQLLADGIHLAAGSPCRGAANASFISGVDIDEQVWATPSSMGCDEWYAAPLFGAQPQPRADGAPPRLRFAPVSTVGQEPFDYAWLKDGTALTDDGHYSSTQSASLTVNSFGPLDAGNYQLVASNAWGVATSEVARVVVHCVDVASSAPSAPFTGWDSAASVLQDALNAADPGDFVLVTNGIYMTGGLAVTGDLTNRAAITKPISVLSMNGPATTAIRGAWDPAATNGPLAVRCVWLADGASLQGFTIRDGGTRASNTSFTSGGGVFATSTNCELRNCVLVGNSAASDGAASYYGTLKSCIISSNFLPSFSGAIASRSLLAGSSVYLNYAPLGNAVANCTLLNCTVLGNTVTWGASNCKALNSIVYYHLRNNSFVANYISGTFTNCCTTPLPPGTGNISAAPYVLDNVHLVATSPCIGMGNPAFSAPEADIDGEPWANPPSMGCDEFYETNITGPILLSIWTGSTSVVTNHVFSLYGTLVGRASRVSWDFGDGTQWTNDPPLACYHAWADPGVYQVTLTASNADYPAGVSTNIVITVDPLVNPAISSAGVVGTNYSLSWLSQYGIFYYVEQSTNLSQPSAWQNLQVKFGTGETVQMLDPIGTNVMRFYRIRMQ